MLFPDQQLLHIHHQNKDDQNTLYIRFKRNDANYYVAFKFRVYHKYAEQ